VTDPVRVVAPLLRRNGSSTAKTLGTHKIISKPSPLLQAEGDNSSLTTSKSLVRRLSRLRSPLRSRTHQFLDFSPSESSPANKPYFSLSLGFPATEIQTSCRTFRSASRSSARVPESVRFPSCEPLRARACLLTLGCRVCFIRKQRRNACHLRCPQLTKIPA
jgi:hypothetical protein